MVGAGQECTLIVIVVVFVFVRRVAMHFTHETVDVKPRSALKKRLEVESVGGSSDYDNHNDNDNEILDSSANS